MLKSLKRQKKIFLPNIKGLMKGDAWAGEQERKRLKNNFPLNISRESTSKQEPPDLKLSYEDA